jgi:hypothetical protein
MEDFQYLSCHTPIPIQGDREHSINFPELPPDLIDNHEKYKVEEVLDIRLHGQWRKCQYLIK